MSEEAYHLFVSLYTYALTPYLEKKISQEKALDEGDSTKLCQELGDLLLQIVLHAQIAKESGEFELGDVMNSINTKLIHRHPHIFGSEKVKDAEEVAGHVCVFGLVAEDTAVSADAVVLVLIQVVVVKSLVPRVRLVSLPRSR
jgi:hypothetical protein